ncbi:DNA gyrase subunit A [Reticulibacter mediterranei]|uniref:DNA gyrase subunit A n=1 Tax=Reticulibacter mediterranei TaxID=2778369 RepID=A0A8J3IS40_9CHLR|nr:DNA gyrase subunit A [Reticulibacter mediterranei]GHO94296.1 DNA gyrase subunit A [Reticulibacter mediterranei]
MELGNIKAVDIVDQMTGAYLDYSMSVIVARALPDVRDGLKPVHRRVLYAMDQMGLQSTKQFRKCAGTVGEVLKSYHPHGDVAVYDTLVRMAQPWSMRYPLILGQGNFGSQDDDPPAAMRYTEAKMAAIADELLRDIEKDTVDFAPNYDNQTTEPTVLPARLPNLLLNGSTGIAVGMATNIPPHNLNEVCNGIIYLIDQPEATTEELARIVRGPDFPTGGIIQGREGIRNMYANGRGRVVVRARTNIEETKGGRSSIIVTELPYQVNKAELVKKIAELARDRRVDGIAEVRDESDREGMRMVIDLKRDANPRSVLNSLYKYTAMQSAFNANMLALVDRQPQTLTLKKFLVHYIHHREIVLTRRTRYELAKAEARKHILDGLKIALDNLDAVINTIRSSQRDTAGLSEELQQQFGFSQEQARAVLDMRLASLAALQRQRVEDELKDVLQHIDYYRMLLSDINEIRKLIKQDLEELKEKYGDARRSEIADDEASDFKDEDLIPNEEAVVTLTEKGYIKRLPSSTYRAQRRGGRGVTGMVTREDDAVLHLLVTHTHDSLLFFTDRGRVFQLRVYELPDTSRTARGEHLINLISIEQRERVTAIVSVPKGISRDFMIVATKKGEVKKTPMDEFEVVRRNGLIAMKLEDDDELVGAKLVHADDDVLLITAQGRAARFSVSELRSASRMSGGVRGIRLTAGDILVSLNVAPEDAELLVVSEYGYGKRTPISEYPRHSRGGGGVMAMRVTEKSGNIAAARVITGRDSDLMIISASGVVIRTDVALVKTSSRVTQGVHLMNLNEGDTVVAVATTNGKKPRATNDESEEDEIEANGDEELLEDTDAVESDAAEAEEAAEQPTETE